MYQLEIEFDNSFYILDIDYDGSIEAAWLSVGGLICDAIKVDKELLGPYILEQVDNFNRGIQEAREQGDF